MTSPVLDEMVLRRLREDVGDPSAVSQFLGRYTDMLDARLNRLSSAWLAHDLDDWHDAALSLKTASAMAGAIALSELVASLLEDVNSRSPVVWWYCTDQGSEVIDALQTLVAQTRCQVDEFLEASTDS